MFEYETKIYEKGVFASIDCLVDMIRQRYFVFYRNSNRIETAMKDITLYKLLRSKKLKKAFLYNYSVCFENFSFYYADNKQEARFKYTTYDPHLTILTADKRRQIQNQMIKYQNIIIILLFYKACRVFQEIDRNEWELIKLYAENYAKDSLKWAEIENFETWSRKVTVGEII